MHVQTWRGASTAACADSTRLSFNLTGTGRSSTYISAGRRIVHSAEPGAVYIAPSGLDFRASNDADAEFLTVVLSAELFSLALGDLGVGGRFPIERVAVPDHRLLDLAKTLHRELKLGLPGGPIYWTEISDALASHVLQRHASRPAVCSASVLSDALIRKIDGLIRDRMDEQITLDDLAGVAGLSRFRFLRAFTKTLGMTPSKYVMHRRLQTAISAARSSRDSLASIAYATGFADQSHLCRWFKRIYGVRISQIRSSEHQ